MTRSETNRLQIMLTWVLALSWVPAVITGIIAACWREFAWSFGIEIVAVFWIVKLAEMFDIIELPEKKNATPAS